MADYSTLPGYGMSNPSMPPIPSYNYAPSYAPTPSGSSSGSSYMNSSAPSTGRSIGSGAAEGAAAGSWAGPYGMLIGAGIGALGSWYGSKKQSDTAQKQIDAARQAEQDQLAANQKALDFQQQQALADYQQREAANRANYEQWKAKEQRLSQIGQMLGLPPRSIPDYVPLPQPNYSGGAGGTQQSSAPSSSQQQGGGSQVPLPQGIDPRLGALYQQYGVTPGDRGSGPADWQYYQYDAVKNANGDINYVLGRLQTDLQKLKGGSSGAPSQGNYGGTLSQYLGMSNPSMGANNTPLPYLNSPQIYNPSQIQSYLGV